MIRQGCVVSSDDEDHDVQTAQDTNHNENAAAAAAYKLSRSRRRMRLLAAKAQAQAQANAKDQINDSVDDEDSNNRIRRSKPTISDEEEEDCVGRVGDARIRDIIVSAFGSNADLYRTVLKVPRDSYEEKLRRAYLHRALEFQTVSLPEDASVEEIRDCGLKNRAVGLAYKILSDDECRKLYDTSGVLTLQPSASRVLDAPLVPQNVHDEKKSRILRKEFMGENKAAILNDDDNDSLDKVQSTSSIKNPADVIAQAFGEETCNLYKDVLRIPKNASDEDVRKAYCMRAMFYHPSRQIEGVTEEQSHKASLRFRAVTVAYKVLANRSSRDQYDKLGTIYIDTGNSDEKISINKPTEISIINKDSRIVNIPSETMHVLDESFGKKADLYEIVLRVSADASKKEIHEGYLRRAMFYHPGRHANKTISEEQAKKASLCFRAVTIAYQTLSNEDLKAMYDKTGRICHIVADKLVHANERDTKAIENVFLPNNSAIANGKVKTHDSIGVTGGDSKWSPSNLFLNFNLCFLIYYFVDRFSNTGTGTNSCFERATRSYFNAIISRFI